jgi:hypothetical protein
MISACTCALFIAVCAMLSMCLACFVLISQLLRWEAEINLFCRFTDPAKRIHRQNLLMLPAPEAETSRASELTLMVAPAEQQVVTASEDVFQVYAE